MKKILAVFVAVIIVFCFTACGNSNNETVQFSMSINCETIAQNMDSIQNEAIKELIPEDGIVFAEANIGTEKVDTIMDATIGFCQAMGISYDKSQGYLSMLADISAGDCGDWSGWLVKVNGEFPEVGADEIELNDGDTIEWIYSLDGGSDIGAW